jgi:hypothetical protein
MMELCRAAGSTQPDTLLVCTEGSLTAKAKLSRTHNQEQRKRSCMCNTTQAVAAARC